MSIGPGPDDPGYDDYDPAWEQQDTPFRLWLFKKLKAAGFGHADDMAIFSAPANRYNGLSDIEIGTLAMLADVTPDEVRAAHNADIAAWRRERQLLDHPDLAVVDADLNRIAGGSR